MKIFACAYQRLNIIQAEAIRVRFSRIQLRKAFTSSSKTGRRLKDFPSAILLLHRSWGKLFSTQAWLVILKLLRILLTVAKFSVLPIRSLGTMASQITKQMAMESSNTLNQIGSKSLA